MTSQQKEIFLGAISVWLLLIALVYNWAFPSSEPLVPGRVLLWCTLGGAGLRGLIPALLEWSTTDD